MKAKIFKTKIPMPGDRRYNKVFKRSKLIVGNQEFLDTDIVTNLETGETRLAGELIWLDRDDPWVRIFGEVSPNTRWVKEGDIVDIDPQVEGYVRIKCPHCEFYNQK
jgi:hypothetical protein